ncbi:MAG: putative signal transduction response regulator, receiver domain protein [Nitrososphaeraceae archaeon]|nr:putative signal transduction response regulator, receiver domain protein [Nitrososphaeraceae archaeon]
MSTLKWFLVMNVLIAEDEHDIALLYKMALERRNHQVTTTENGENCLKAYHEKCQNRRFAIHDIGQMLPFDVVILDHKMPKINGMQVAEEILAMNPRQRIIFASAYVKETLTDSIRTLKQVVELMQKPFNVNTLIDTVEDKEIYSELKRLDVDLDIIKAINPTHEQIIDLLKRLRTVQKGRTF